MTRWMKASHEGGPYLQRMIDDITLSALVVLRPRLPAPRGGIAGRPAGHGPLAREALEAATGFFARKGFAIEDVVGTSFWIMSHPRRFEDLFGQALEITRRQNRVQSARLRDGSTEFNLSPLPEDIARLLLAVTFTEPLIAQWLNAGRSPLTPAPGGRSFSESPTREGRHG